MRKITVTGKGKLQVKPELTEVKLIIKGLEDEYYQALAKSVDETNVVKMILINNGLPKESLKTQTFDVYKKTKQIKDQYGNYHDKFLGYEYDHVIAFKFENNNELLGKLLFEISKLKVNPEVRVKYLIKDFEKAKQIFIDSINFAANYVLQYLFETDVTEDFEIMSKDGVCTATQKEQETDVESEILDVVEN